MNMLTKLAMFLIRVWKWHRDSWEKNMSTKVRNSGFTIIEVLTVISIIAILITITVPSINAARRYAKNVVQKGQFHDIVGALEVYKNEFGDYPDSTDNSMPPTDPYDPSTYCGAMKLCEAMMGKDGLGLNVESNFTCDHSNTTGTYPLYGWDPCSPPPEENLRNRHAPYLGGRNFQRYPIVEVLTSSNTFQCGNSLATARCEVISDVFRRFTVPVSPVNSKVRKVGLPVLYFKATENGVSHEFGLPNNIYDISNNWAIIDHTWPRTKDHEWSDAREPAGGGPEKFYADTRDQAVTALTVPHNLDSFILVAAGSDGLYGTRDDIFNFTNAR